MNSILKLWHKALSTSVRLLRRAEVVVLIFIIGLVGYCKYSLEAPKLTKTINEEYYFTHQTSGFATTSNHRHIKVYKKRAWLPDKKIAHLDMIDYSGREDVEINYQLNRLQLIIDKQVELDTLIDESEYLEMDFNAFIERRRKR